MNLLDEHFFTDYGQDAIELLLFSMVGSCLLFSGMLLCLGRRKEP